MQKAALTSAIMATFLFPGCTHALAGPWEDGMVAYNRGDYVPAIRLFRSLAPAEMSQAEAMAEACAASNYRACEY